MKNNGGWTVPLSVGGGGDSRYHHGGQIIFYSRLHSSSNELQFISWIFFTRDNCPTFDYSSVDGWSAWPSCTEIKVGILTPFKIYDSPF